MSGIVACPWNGSQVGPVISWPLTQPLLKLQILTFLGEKINFGSKVCGWVDVSIAPLGFLPGYRRWPLQVPHPQCCVSQLRSPPLTLGHLPYPRSLGDIYFDNVLYRL